MRFHKLRIAWSVVCGIACVLLVVLWVRSYSFVDSVTYRSKNTLGVVSRTGSLCFASVDGAIGKGFSFGSERLQFIQTNLLPHNTFEWRTVAPTMTVIFVPHWSVVITLGVLCAATMIPWSNHFSLRTLLIATTVVAVVLGLAVFAAKK
jgi:hypothetical protein